MTRPARLILVLTAVGWMGLLGVGGLLYLLWVDSDTRFLELRDRQLESHQSVHATQMETRQQITALSSQQQHVQKLVDQFLEELRVRYATYETLLKEKLDPIEPISDPRQYPIEEVAFLLNIAQYKQNHLQDSLGTLSALRQAQRILATLDQVRFHTLRKQVDDAIATLEAYSGKEAEAAHRILTASWLVLNDKITTLHDQLVQQNETVPAHDWGQLWDTFLEHFSTHVEVLHGTPQAVQTISAYQHIMNLYAIQTELYLARLSLQAHRIEAYTQALAQANRLLAQPTLQEHYPALQQDLQKLTEQHPFPPSIDFSDLQHSLERSQLQ